MNTSCKNRKSSSKVIVGALLASMAFSPSAFGVFALFPIQIIQWMTAELGNIASIAEQIDTTQNTLQTVQNGIQQIEQAEKELKALSPSQLTQYNRYIDQLSSVMAQTNGMAYNLANIDSRFDSIFPSYDNSLNGVSGTQRQKQNTFSNQYKAILDNNRGTALGTLKNLKNTSDHLDNDNATIEGLKATSNSAEGNLQAIQAANAIAIHQTETLKDLHRTMLSQQSLMVVQQQQVIEQQAKEKAMAEKLRLAHRPILGDEPVQKTW